MSYAMLPDELLVGLEAAGITRDARLLYIEGLVHCATVPTDGDIRVRLERISDAEDPASLADDLIAADLWVREDKGYRIVRYLSAEGGHQRSREQVLRDRENNRKRQANYRQKVAESKARNAVTDTVTSGVSNAPLPIPSLPDPKGGEGRDEGSTEGALTRASATPSPEIEPHVFAERFTGKCGWCGKGQSNPLHQKASQYLQRASETLRSLGALTFTVTRRGNEHLDLIADIPGYGLKLQYNTDDEQIGWAELDIPGEVINFDAGPIDAALDRIMAAAIPEAEPPSEYEPMDADHLDNVRAHIELVIVDEFSRTRPWQDVLPHLGTFISLAPAFTAATYNPEEVAA